jgi:hypothetical protein
LCQTRDGIGVRVQGKSAVDQANQVTLTFRCPSAMPLKAQHWSAKLEYLYTNFGTHTFYTVFILVNVKESNVNIVRAGINYHF